MSQTELVSQRTNHLSMPALQSSLCGFITIVEDLSRENISVDDTALAAMRAIFVGAGGIDLVGSSLVVRSGFLEVV